MFSFCFSCTCVCAHSPPLSCACAQFYSLKIPAWCNALRAMNACLWDGVCQMMCIRKVLKEPIESKHMLTFLNLSLGWYALEVADTLEEQSVEWICISKGWLLSSQILKATKHLLQDYQPTVPIPARWSAHTSGWMWWKHHWEESCLQCEVFLSPVASGYAWTWMKALWTRLQQCCRLMGCLYKALSEKLPAMLGSCPEVMIYSSSFCERGDLWCSASSWLIQCQHLAAEVISVPKWGCRDWALGSC